MPSRRLLVLTTGLIGAFLGSTIVARAAPAQQAPAAAAAPAAVPADPATTSATYGDWVMRCQRVGDGAAAKRVCEVSQTIRLQDAREPIAEVALGRLPVEKTLHLTALLPPNVSFPSAVSVAVGDKAASAVDLQWRRCLPGGCFADATASDELVKAWRTQVGAGKLTFKDAGGRDVALPISFRGLAQALDALDKA